MPSEEKAYCLMHREIAVADLVLDEATGSIAALQAVHAQDHLPPGIPVRGGKADRAALNAWWTGRAIPVSRAGLRRALDVLKIDTPQILVEKGLGLSLSDQYWICPKDSGIQWEKVNFFDNGFSEDMGVLLLTGDSAGQKISLLSPDNTSDGWLRKRWVISDGKRRLIKGGSGAIQQEPYNEVIASRIMEKLGIPHVEYTLEMQNGAPCCICDDFVTRDTEYITAWQILHTKPKPNHVSVYRHYLDRCAALGVPDVRRAVSQQITVDYLIANEDRHQGNFGVLRDARTLEYLGAAPLFDCGSSLWFELPSARIRATAKVGCKPFKTDHEDQLWLIEDFSWLDVKKLSDLGSIAKEVFAGSEFVDESRARAISNALDERADLLRECVLTRTQSIDDLRKDVRKNVAYSGRAERKNNEMER